MRPHGKYICRSTRPYDRTGSRSLAGVFGGQRMQVRCGGLVSRSVLALLLSVGLVSSQTAAQNFRGGISGSVTDPTGAAVPGAQVVAVATSTNTTHRTITSSAGEFAFSDLPLGNYTVTVLASGFAAENIKNVSVSAGVTYALP